MDNKEHTFGSLDLPKETHEKLTLLLNTIADRESLRNNVVTRSLDLDCGNVTDLQWQVADELTSQPKPTLIQIANKLGKNNYNSIQKTRDALAKNVIEALVTVSFILQDPNVIDLVMEIIDR